MKKDDINKLWIWGRQPSSRIRYDHGGFNASFPINDHTVMAQVHFFKKSEAAEKAAEELKLSQPEPPSNILTFPSSPLALLTPPTRMGARTGTGIRKSNRFARRFNNRTNEAGRPESEKKSPVETLPKKD